jgi:hypothetical protein
MSGFIQSVIDDHDESLTRVYYNSPEQFNLHYNTVETQVFRHNKKVNTIHHIIKKERDSTKL